MTAGEPTVSLPMYPSAELRPAWQQLWGAVHRRLGGPQELTWDDDVHRLWLDPQLSISQSCGWPATTTYADRLVPVGAFDPRIPGASNARYRSVLIARKDALPTELGRATAAVNSDDSLSGWISLTVAVSGTPGRWDGEVRWTGGHAASIEAVVSGEADIASIDAVTWALLGDLDRRPRRGIVVVGRGPRVPCLPIVVPHGASARRIAAVRAAFGEACTDPSTAEARHRLRIRGFVPLGRADYAGLPALGGWSPGAT